MWEGMSQALRCHRLPTGSPAMPLARDTPCRDHSRVVQGGEDIGLEGGGGRLKWEGMGTSEF